MYIIKKEFKLCCSHTLNNEKLSKTKNVELFGKCNENHGHNYKVILCFKSKELDPSTGMIINFDEIKKVFKKYIDDVFDHKNLNTLYYFNNIIPTAENMAELFYDIIKKNLSDLYAVEIYETDGASAIYVEDKNED